MESNKEQNIQKLIDKYHQDYKFEKNPLGGYYKILNESPQIYKVENNLERKIQNTVYSFYEKGQFFPFHSLKYQEESFFHIDGGVLNLIILPQNDQNNAQHIKLGKNIDNGQVLHYKMQPGSIFACYTESDFVLLGVMCTPGWHFDDNTVYEKQDLLKKYPQYQDFINKYSKNE